MGLFSPDFTDITHVNNPQTTAEEAYYFEDQYKTICQSIKE